MMIPVTKTPKWQKYIRKYEAAKKRYIIALYEEHVGKIPPWKGYGDYLWVNVTQILPSERGFAYEWVESKWVTGKEYDANPQYKDWSHGGTISKLDFAKFMFHGWARKAGQSTKL